ncbi:MAG: hypothetical protein IH848_05805, partial [Acidobacteria bacterium]|nr:hypothetical protein [Acidobacteriota bacterium]
GVKGVKLGGQHDRVVGMGLVRSRASLWVITEEGNAKSVSLNDYPRQGRYGSGVVTVKLAAGEWLAASAIGTMDDNLIVVTSKGKPKYMRFSLARRGGRAIAGKSVVAMSSKEGVALVVVPRESQHGASSTPGEKPPASKPARPTRSSSATSTIPTRRSARPKNPTATTRCLPSC